MQVNWLSRSKEELEENVEENFTETYWQRQDSDK